MKPHGSARWELLGHFTAAPAEIAALRSVLSRHEDPLEALDAMPRGLLWDALDVCRLEGHAVRVHFED